MINGLFPWALRCSGCGAGFPQALINVCSHCGSPILVEYEITAAPLLREQIRSRPALLWRYREILPLTGDQQIVTLGEGATPLLEATSIGKSLGLRNFHIKDESRNPTRSFKSRGMSVAVSMAKYLGARRLLVPTAGNAGAALAAYGARAGLPVFVAMPADTPAVIAEECRMYGAEVLLVEGVITDAAKQVQVRVAAGEGFDLSTLKEPYRVEGKKIMGYELLDDLGRLPDAIIYPTGGGTGLIGMWKAFGEMERLGWIGRERPRMFAVQAAGCAPIVRAVEQGADTAGVWSDAETGAWGLRVPRAIGDRLMLTAIRTSGGGAVAVPEEMIEPAAAELRALEGIDAGPETGAGLAGLRQLMKAGTISPDERVVLFNTGANKYGFTKVAESI